MNNLLHLFEENPMKKVDKDMFRDYVRAPFPKDDDSWKDMFDIKRYNKMVHIYHNTTGEGLYGVARRDFINDQGAPDKQITQFSYCGNHKKYVNANLWSEEPHLHNEHLMADSKQDTCGVVEGEKKQWKRVKNTSHRPFGLPLVEDYKILKRLKIGAY